MSNFQQRYTPRQKRAVGLAQLDRGMTARSALDAFHRGELTDVDGAIPPPAKPMPMSTAHDCAAKIRAEREGRRGGLESKEPSAARAELLRRLTVAADRLTRRLERKSRTGTDDPKLADSLTKAARATREVIAAQRAAETPPPAIRPPSGNGSAAAPEPERDSSPLADIAADVEREDRRAAARPPSIPDAPA